MSGYDLSQLSACTRCPRLVAHLHQVAGQYPGYHAAPVGSWGDRRGRALLIGLAPGLHGAARTGKAFVGDASGDFLFRALHRAGFATEPDPRAARLRDMQITNVVKCLPPGNAPTSAELHLCMGFLRQELTALLPHSPRKPRVLIALGGVAHRAVGRALGLRGVAFAHGAEHAVADQLMLLASFHPSRLNVNTGRITETMLDDIFLRVRKLL